ncbi:ArnT family glycosyltransferase [Helicobacter fennelliae]|uniref:Glycosyltransferase RgtA/B/C/D-like domain-containing protein n=2 Tax=Helicobacter TaxID=209 RepID=T1CMS1_9HELI|nr:glycosyltransferase family 39 protein [Helicobacter fennelliae]GAD18064.1 hypothetical protein HFN_1662 [Helicobacter fennelliae MRY12-0050]
MSKNIPLYMILLACFLVFVFMDYRYLDVEFLSLSRGDEMPQFLQLQKMYEGLIELNIKKLFAFEFYNYGFAYYILNLFITLPFWITQNYELAIYAPRILNAIFSLMNVVLLYIIAKAIFNRLTAYLLVLIFITSPGFWQFGFMFKPNVFQAFFVLLSAYFLLKDSFYFGRNYTLGCVTLGLGVGLAKFQAVMFLPLLFTYIAVPFCFERNAKAFKLACKRIILSTCGVIALFILTNPYLLHPRGMRAWWSMFEGNMKSNATNHGAYTQVSFSDKIFQVIDFYYFEILVFIALLVLCGIVLWRCVRLLRMSHFNFNAESNTMLCFGVIVFGGFLISLAYLLFFVNKTWGDYYFSTMLLGMLLLGLFSLRDLFRIQNKQIAFNAAGGGGGKRLCGKLCQRLYVSILCGFLALQILGGFMNASYKQVFNKYNVNLDSAYSLSDEIVDMLEKVAPKNTAYNIITDTPNFRYLQLGLEPKNIYQTFGLLDPRNFVYEEWNKETHTFEFVPKDFIIISKSSKWLNPDSISLERDKHFATSVRTLQALLNNKLPFVLIAQSKHFMVFKNIDTQHTLIQNTPIKE